MVAKSQLLALPYGLCCEQGLWDRDCPGAPQELPTVVEQSRDPPWQGMQGQLGLALVCSCCALAVARERKPRARVTQEKGLCHLLGGCATLAMWAGGTGLGLSFRHHASLCVVTAPSSMGCGSQRGRCPSPRAPGADDAWKALCAAGRALPLGVYCHSPVPAPASSHGPTLPVGLRVRCLGTPSHLLLWLRSLFPASAGMEVAIFFSSLPARSWSSVLILGGR